MMFGLFWTDRVMRMAVDNPFRPEILSARHPPKLHLLIANQIIKIFGSKPLNPAFAFSFCFRAYSP